MRYRIHQHIIKHKDKYKGALIFLCLQIMVGGVGAWLLFHYYDTLTVEAGTVEQFVTKQVDLYTPTSVVNTGGMLSYSGVLGRFRVMTKQEGSSLLDTTKRILQQVDLTKLPSYLYTKYLYQKGYIDAYMLRYLLNIRQHYVGSGMSSVSSDYEKFFEHTIDNLTFVQHYLPTKIIDTNPPDFSPEIHTYEQLIDQQCFDQLATNIDKEEQFLAEIEANKTQRLSNNLFKSAQFLYLLDKLHTDVRGMYRDHIMLASKVFDLNPNLIKAAILTEQLRGFFTYRGMMKQIIASQKYMMVMQQSSRGIGGIKLKTAKRIESYLQQHYLNIRNQYFTFTSTNAYHERYARLTNSQDYFWQIMYVAANLAMNRDEWKQAGYDISYTPGVLLTLYNIGEKPPRDNPEIGGAELNIAGQKYSFGGLGMLIFYFLEVYG